MSKPTPTFDKNAAGNGTQPSPIGGSPLGTTDGVQDYTNNGEAVVIVTVIMMIVTTLIVALRIAARFFVLRLRGADDWLIMAATAVTIANVACIVIGVKYGTGRHESTLPITESQVAIKYRLISHLLYTAATVLVKSSILMLYLRLFPGLRWAIIGTLTFVITMGVTFILGASFRCRPIGASWNPWNYKLNSFTCFSALPFWIAFGSLFLASDLVVLILPMKTILGLHISRKKKMILIFLLSLGAFACVAGVVRLVYVIKLYTTEDASWNTAFVSISSTIEICCAITAASIPPTKVFVDRLFPNLISSTRQGTSYWQQRPLGSVELVSNTNHHRHNPTGNANDSARLRAESKNQPSIVVTRNFQIEVSPSSIGNLHHYYREPPPYRTRNLSEEHLR